VITHSPGFESFGAETERRSGLRGRSIYKFLARLAERRFLREARVEPARHGTLDSIPSWAKSCGIGGSRFIRDSHTRIGVLVGQD
jgi:hypothetical protein